MRDMNRIDPFLQQIGEIWKQNPDLRFMQLVLNVMQHVGGHLYYIEDDEFLEYLNSYYTGGCTDESHK